MKNYNELNDEQKKLVAELNDFWGKNPELKKVFCKNFGSKAFVILDQYAKQAKEEA